MTFSNSNLPPE